MRPPPFWLCLHGLIAVYAFSVSSAVLAGLSMFFIGANCGYLVGLNTTKGETH